MLFARTSHRQRFPYNVRLVDGDTRKLEAEDVFSEPRKNYFLDDVREISHKRCVRMPTSLPLLECLETLESKMEFTKAWNRDKKILLANSYHNTCKAI